MGLGPFPLAMTCGTTTFQSRAQVFRLLHGPSESSGEFRFEMRGYSILRPASPKSRSPNGLQSGSRPRNAAIIAVGFPPQSFGPPCPESYPDVGIPVGLSLRAPEIVRNLSAVAWKRFSMLVSKEDYPRSLGAKKQRR